MGAPLNNQNAVGHGRPRSIARELARLREAAQQVDRLIETRALVSVMANLDDPPPLELYEAKENLRQQIAEIERAAAVIERVTGRRQHGTLGADSGDQALMQAGAALDRAAGKGGSAQ